MGVLKNSKKSVDLLIMELFTMDGSSLEFSWSVVSQISKYSEKSIVSYDNKQGIITDNLHPWEYYSV